MADSSGTKERVVEEPAPASSAAEKPAPDAAASKDHDKETEVDADATDVEAAPVSSTEKPNGVKGEDEPLDPDVVFWDSDDDPHNPQNWPNSAKWRNIAIMSILTLMTPLGSSMFAPGVPEILVEFKTTSTTLATFVVSIYILGFAFGPLVVAPLSEMYGRLPVYHVTNVLFLIFCVATALSKNMGMLIAFRFLMGLAGSTPVTIGSGTIADMMPLHQRGRAMSAWAIGPLLGPVIGPVCGGYLVQAKGWRWVFWVIAIVGGAIVLLSFLFLRETYAPALLDHKTARLRKETGNPNLRNKLSPPYSRAKQLELGLIRPSKMLFTVPTVFLMSLYTAVAYGVLYLLFTTFSFVYQEQYGFNSGDSGLTFIPAGVGMILGVAIFGRMSDQVITSRQKKGLEIKPEHRLDPYMTIPSGLLLPIGLFIYGWTIQKGVHWIVPMIGVVLVGGSLMGIMMCVQTYIVDSYLKFAASAIAASTVLRSIAGALLPLGGLQMYQTLGLGWGNSLLAFIALALLPIPVLFRLYGDKLRTRSQPML